MLNKSASIRIVLVNTTHPGNIGAVARAMANMGLTQLYLVSPKFFPHHEATARAAGADVILQQAVCVDTLEQAIAGCELVIGTSARRRSLPWPLLTPRQAAVKLQAFSGKTAIVFGCEQFGLSNQQLSLCQYHLTIPCNENFPSLNIAQAVQIVTYELRMAALETNEASAPFDQLATADEMQGFMEQLQQVLFAVDFLAEGKEKSLTLRLRRLFHRAQLEQTEIHILRGMLTAIEKKLIRG